MKRILYLISTAMLVFSACNVEEPIVAPDSEGATVEISVAASLGSLVSGDIETKASTTPVIRLSWYPWSEVSVFNISKGGVNIGTLANQSDENGLVESTFSGSLQAPATGDRLLLVYPSQPEAATITDVRVSFDLQEGLQPLFCATKSVVYDGSAAMKLKMKAVSSIVNLHMTDIPNSTVDRIKIKNVNTFIGFDQNGEVVYPDQKGDVYCYTLASVTPSESGYFEITMGLPSVEESSERTLMLFDRSGNGYVTEINNSALEASKFYNFVAAGFRKSESDLANNISQGVEFVDLGLPSGTLWATSNLGAKRSSEPGDFYKWGEVSPAYTAQILQAKNLYLGVNWNSVAFGSNGDPMKAYLTPDSEGNLTPISGSEFDAAQKSLGGFWEMPTSAQFEELLNPANCDYRFDMTGDVPSLVFTSKRNGTSLTFPCIPYWSETTSEGQFTNIAGYWTADAYPDQIPYGGARSFHIYMDQETGIDPYISFDYRYDMLQIRPVSSPVQMDRNIVLPNRGGDYAVSVKTVSDQVSWKFLLPSSPWFSVKPGDGYTVSGNTVQGTGSCDVIFTCYANYNGEERTANVIFQHQKETQANRTTYVIHVSQAAIEGQWGVLSDEEIHFGAEAETRTVKLTTGNGVSWAIDMAGAAQYHNLQVSPMSGTGSAEITISVSTHYTHGTDMFGWIQFDRTDGQTGPSLEITIDQEEMMEFYPKATSDSFDPTSGCYHKFVDLGLPSGNLWAVNDYRYDPSHNHEGKASLGIMMAAFIDGDGTSLPINYTDPNASFFERSYDDNWSPEFADAERNISNDYFIFRYWWDDFPAVPVKAEYEELINYCTWSYENGRKKCTGPNGNFIYFDELVYWSRTLAPDVATYTGPHYMGWMFAPVTPDMTTNDRRGTGAYRFILHVRK